MVSGFSAGSPSSKHPPLNISLNISLFPVPIIDAAFAVPRNSSDSYDTYYRGQELNIWMKEAEKPDTEYWGRVWPGEEAALIAFVSQVIG